MENKNNKKKIKGFLEKYKQLLKEREYYYLKNLEIEAILFCQSFNDYCRVKKFILAGEGMPQKYILFSYTFDEKTYEDDREEAGMNEQIYKKAFEDICNELNEMEIEAMSLGISIPDEFLIKKKLLGAVKMKDSGLLNPCKYTEISHLSDFIIREGISRKNKEVKQKQKMKQLKEKNKMKQLKEKNKMKQDKSTSEKKPQKAKDNIKGKTAKTKKQEKNISYLKDPTEKMLSLPTELTQLNRIEDPIEEENINDFKMEIEKEIEIKEEEIEIKEEEIEIKEEIEIRPMPEFTILKLIKPIELDPYSDDENDENK